jgi:glucose/arabinose dehydrogenase
VPPQVADDLVAGLRSPTALAFMPDGRMPATTQPGQLRVISGGVPRPAPALDLKTRMCTDSERGRSRLAGVSRATAQRHLSSLADEGSVDIQLRYGTTGRPEHRYGLPARPGA